MTEKWANSSRYLSSVSSSGSSQFHWVQSVPLGPVSSSGSNQFLWVQSVLLGPISSSGSGSWSIRTRSDGFSVGSMVLNLPVLWFRLSGRVDWTFWDYLLVLLQMCKLSRRTPAALRPRPGSDRLPVRPPVSRRLGLQEGQGSVRLRRSRRQRTVPAGRRGQSDPTAWPPTRTAE